LKVVDAIDASGAVDAQSQLALVDVYFAVLSCIKKTRNITKKGMKTQQYFITAV
jgi:hypothetical protein